MSAKVGMIDAREVVVYINGKRYVYTGRNGETGYELADHFGKIAKYSEGKALAWLKKQAVGVRAELV